MAYCYRVTNESTPMSAAANTPAQTDRHQALRLENNRAIKLAALALSEDRGLGNFTVEELAAKAEVSRRTFFNHFGSIHEATRAALRDILFDASEDVLAAMSNQTAAAQPQSLSQLFELAALAIQSVDVTGTIRRSCSVLGSNPRENPMHSAWFREVFDAITEDFDLLLAASAPQLPALSRNLLVRLLLTSVEVCAEEWSATGLGLNQTDGLALWRQIHGSAIQQLRDGFGAA